MYACTYAYIYVRTYMYVRTCIYVYIVKKKFCRVCSSPVISYPKQVLSSEHLITFVIGQDKCKWVDILSLSNDQIAG